MAQVRREEGQRITRVAVATHIEVTDQRIAELLVGAFEGGSNYWVSSISHRPDKWNREDCFKLDRLDLPFEVFDGEDTHPETGTPKAYEVTRGSLQRGLQLMAEKHPRHWADFVNKNDDAETADVFLQLAALGELTYG